jgi:hypothetical protein
MQPLGFEKYLFIPEQLFQAPTTLCGAVIGMDWLAAAYVSTQE